MWKDLAWFFVITTDILAYTGAGMGLGWLAWKKGGMPWWFLLLGSSLGLFLAMWKIKQRMARMGDGNEGK